MLKLMGLPQAFHRSARQRARRPCLRKFERIIDVPQALIWKADQVAQCELFLFPAVLLLEPHPKEAKYTALVTHRDEVGREQQEAMGFHEGWRSTHATRVDHSRSPRLSNMEGNF